MILDAFKFTNNLFSAHFSKYLLVVFPVFIIIFIANLLMPSVQGNEFGTTTSFNYQELVSNLFMVYASILAILLTDDIYKERKRNISSYFSIGALLYFKVIIITAISIFLIVLLLVPSVGLAIFLTGSPTEKTTASLLLAGLLFFILVLPIPYVAVRLSFASYLAAIFNERIFDSFSKSIEITEGKGWKVLGYILAMVVPLMFIMILALIGPAFFLLPENMYAYMGLTLVLTCILTIYMTIYIYRLLLNLMDTSHESIEIK